MGQYIYVVDNIFLSAPYQTPKDELFQRATSFQDFLEEELKTHYTTEQTSWFLCRVSELAIVVLRGVAGLRGSEQSEGTETTCRPLG